MFLSGVQSGFRLDSRLKHAGMTDLGWGIYFTQQAAANRPTQIEGDNLKAGDDGPVKTGWWLGKGRL
jgi:hypothetical protein